MDTILVRRLQRGDPGGHTRRALGKFPVPEIADQIQEWTLIPSRGGVFEVTVNGTLVFSKKALGRHAEDGELLPLIKAAL